MCGDVPKVHYGVFVRSQWYGKYQEYLCGKDAVLSHVICDLVKTENNTEKYPNTIDYYDTATIFLLQSIFVRNKVRENTVSYLFSTTRNDIQKQRKQIKK